MTACSEQRRRVRVRIITGPSENRTLPPQSFRSFRRCRSATTSLRKRNWSSSPFRAEGLGHSVRTGPSANLQFSFAGNERRIPTVTPETSVIALSGRLCRQKGTPRSRARGFAGGLPLGRNHRRYLPTTGKMARYRKGNDESFIVFSQEDRAERKSSVFLSKLFEQRCLLARQFPILLFYGFGETGKFQMRIRVARGIKKMLKHGPAGMPAGSSNWIACSNCC